MDKKYLEDIEQIFDSKTAMEEASRCLLCLDAPCSKECPAKTDPASFIRSLRFLNFKGGAETIRTNNALGAVCGRVCPEEKYCQKGCIRSGIDKPIEIGKLQKFLTDFEVQVGLDVYEKADATGKKIAIIGSGPSSLQAATSLLLLGHDVTIYEKNAKLGGYLRYGIPEYRLSSKVLDSEIERIQKIGLKAKLNINVGVDISLDSLQKNYDAVIIAAGFSKGKMLEEFANHPNVRIAVDFLKEVKERRGNIELPDNVLVIGGGDVAMDVDVSLKLLGVQNVTNVVYEHFDEFRASQKELNAAQALKVTILDGYMIKRVVGEEVTFVHRKLESLFTIKSDLVILAVGQVSDLTGLNVAFEDKRIDSDRSHLRDNLFITGDLHTGDKTVVYGVKLGKEVAKKVNTFLIGGK